MLPSQSLCEVASFFCPFLQHHLRGWYWGTSVTAVLYRKSGSSISRCQCIIILFVTILYSSHCYPRHRSQAHYPSYGSLGSRLFSDPFKYSEHLCIYDKAKRSGSLTLLLCNTCSVFSFQVFLVFTYSRLAYYLFILWLASRMPLVLFYFFVVIIIWTTAISNTWSLVESNLSSCSS